MLYFNKCKYILIGFCVYLISYFLLYQNFNTNESNDIYFLSENKVPIFGPYWMIIESKESCKFLASQYPSWNIFMYNPNSFQNLNNLSKTKNCMDIYQDIFLSFINDYNLFKLSKILQIFLFSIKKGAILIYHKINDVFDDIEYLKEAIRVSTQSRKWTYISKKNNLSNSTCNIFQENIKYCNIDTPAIIFYSYYSPNILSIKSNKSIDYYDINGLAYSGKIKLDLGKLSKPVYSSDSFAFLSLFYFKESEMNLLHISQKEIMTMIIELNFFEKKNLYVYFESPKKILKCKELNNGYSTNLTKLYNYIMQKEDKNNKLGDSIKENFGSQLFTKLLLWKESLNKLVESNIVKKSLKSISSNFNNNCYNITLSREYISNQKYISKNYNDICGKIHSTSILPIKVDIFNPPFEFPNVLLIIVFNKAHYEVIPILEVLYRRRFRRIVYCGPYLPNNLDKDIIFLTFDYKPVNEVDGAYNYECTIKAIEIGFKVDGYFIISDDLLLFSDISKFPLDQIWFQPITLFHTFDYKLMSQCRANECIYLPRWRWFLDYKRQVVRLLHDMQNSGYWLIERCSNNLIKFNNGAKSRIHGAYADVFYLPNKYSSEFAGLGRYFLEHHIFLEIAVPTIIICLLQNDDSDLSSNKLNYKEIKGMEIWTEKRNYPWLYWEKARNSRDYLHPTKWSHLFANNYTESIYKTISKDNHILISNWTNLLCNNLIPYMYPNAIT